QQDAFGGGIGFVGVGFGNLPFGEDVMFRRGGVGIKDVEFAVDFELRMKREREESFFVVHKGVAVGNIEEQFWFGAVAVGRQNPDVAVLLENELAMRAIRGFDHGDGAAE